MIIQAIDVAFGSGWMLPVCPGDIPPPVSDIPHIHSTCGLGKNHRSGLKQFFGHTGIVRRIKRLFHGRHISGFLNKFAKLRIGDFGSADRKGRNRHLMDFGFFPINAVFPHQEGSTRQFDKLRQVRSTGGGCCKKACNRQRQDREIARTNISPKDRQSRHPIGVPWQGNPAPCSTCQTMPRPAQADIRQAFEDAGSSAH
ncbi:hypothetical protein THPR109532_10455 [Thalassospira profundimaris]